MSIRTETEVPQRVATPAFLHQRLQSFRIGRADRQSYVLRDTLQGKNYDFEPWQFFALEVLPGCTDEEKLASVFEDRFGYRMSLRDFEQFFASVADANLFNEAAASHPLLARFSKKTYVVEGETARAKSFQAMVAEQPVAASGAGRGGTEVAPAPGAVRPAPNPAAKKPDADETLPAGMHGAPDFDPRASRWMLVLFNPTWLLKFVVPLVWPLRHIIYAIPLALLGALILSGRHAYEIEGDLTRLLEGFGFVKHWVASLLTVNLAVVCTTAVLAFKYRATVSGFGIALIMGFYPRFATRVSHLDQLSRVERMWLHGTPMLVRLLAFSIGIYLWYGTRATNEQVATVALAVAMTGGISLLFSANPLIKSSGYHLLSAFTNEPHLRGKAFKTLLNKLRGGAFKEANELLLATYAIATAAFMFVMVAGAAAFTGFALHQLHLGGSAIILATIVAIALLRRVTNYFRRVETAYDRSLQFDRWRRRTHRQDEPSDESGASASGPASYVWRAVLLTILIALFLPYPYHAGGEFVIYPKLRQDITADVSGRIEEVFFNGGEEVAKGTVVARLATNEAQAQANVLDKKMIEQQAVIDHMELLPRPENVQVARMALDVEKTRIEFSKLQLERVKKIADQGYAAGEELDETRRQLEVDLKQLAEKQAALEVAKLGPTEFEIAAAQAELESLRAQRDVYLDRIERSELVMPFDGRVLTLHLKHKGNSYYESGDVLATAEESGPMTAELEVPEADTEYLKIGSTVQFTPIAYSSEVFVGTVVHIDWTITEKPFGNVIKVIAALEDDSGRLKSGMTGYAKVEGPSLLVWEAFSRQIVRFFEVQVWSWIP